METTLRIFRLPAVCRLAVCIGGLASFGGCGPDPAVEEAAIQQLQQMKAIAIPNEKGQLTSLTLALPGVQERMDEIVPLIAQLPYLGHLDLTGTNLRDEHLDVIASRKSLNSLILTDTAITDVGLSKLKRLADTLDNLSLANTQITSEGLKVVGTFRKLLVLDLTNTDTANGLDALSSLDKVNWLRLSGLELPSSFVDAVTAMEGLQLGRLDLQDCVVSEGDLAELAKRAPQMRVLFSHNEEDAGATEPGEF